MTDTYERCSCGARDRAKCNKESLSGGGKMCVKEIKAERQEALAYPNTISVEEAFNYMFDKYENALEELAEK